MDLLLEFFYCFIYVCSMMICVYKYTNKKLNKIEYVFLLIIYSSIDYIITGKIILDINYRFLIDFLVIASDFIMVSLFNKKFSLYIFLYTTIFYTLYSEVIIIITSTLDNLPNFSVLFSYEPSIMRFTLVTLFSLTTITLFKCLEKKKIIPMEDITKDKYKIFCLINILVILVCTIFQWQSIVGTINPYLQIALAIFIILWLVLLYILNSSFALEQQKENQIIMNSIHRNIDQYIHQYKKDEEKIKKVKHDIKNHLIIIKNLDNKENINKYINNVFLDLENMNVLSNILSGNMYVDAIINSKKSEYPDVHIKCVFNIPDLSMNSTDLGIILFNLLDNACRAAKQAKGQVDLKMIYDGMCFIIEMKNSCVSKTDFVSKRGVGHGYGTNIVKDIVKKYNGNIEFQSYDHEVKVKVGLII